MATTIRKLTLQAEALGYREATGAVRQLGGATQDLTKEVRDHDAIRERADRRLAARERILRAEAKAAYELARATKVHTDALAQNLITAERYRENIALERQRAYAPVERTAVNDNQRRSAGWDRLGEMGGANLANIEASRRLAGMGTAGKEAAHGVGLAKTEMINLGYQLNDIGTMLAMGQSPLMILASQGGQVAQIFMGAEGGVVAGIKGAGSALLTFLANPITLTIAGIAAVGAAMAYFIGGSRKGVTDLDAVFEGHRRTIQSLRDDYKGVAAGIREVIAESRDLQRLRAEHQERQQRTQINQEAGSVIDQAGSVSRSRGIGERYIVGSRYRPFEEELGQLREQLKRHEPDIVGFVEHVHRTMAQRPNDSYLRQVGDELVRLAEKGVDLQRKLPGLTQSVEAFKRAFSGDPFASYEDGLGRLIDMVPRLKEAADRARTASSIQEAYRNAETGYRVQQSAGDISPGQANSAIAEARRIRDEALEQAASVPTMAEERTQRFNLELRAVHARTDAERALIAAEQRRLDLANDSSFDKPARELEAERARTLDLERAKRRLADADRDRNLAVAEQFAAARADITMLGQSAAAIEEERFKRERLAEITRDELQNGTEWANRQRAAVDDLAKAWGQLHMQGARAKAANDLLFREAQLGRSEAERDVYSEMQSRGLLQNGEPVDKELANGFRIMAQLEKQTSLTRDLAFEREKLFMSDGEAQIAERLRGAGVEIESAYGRWAAGVMRVTETLREAKEAGRDFFTGTISAIAGGEKPLDALASSAKRLSSQLAEQGANRIYDSLWSAAASSVPGLKELGIGPKPDGSSAARALWVQIAASGTGLDSVIGALKKPTPASAMLSPARVEQAKAAMTGGAPTATNAQMFSALRTTGTGNVKDLNPVFRDRLTALQAATDRELGEGLSVYSGYRSREHQARLYAEDIRKNGGRPSGYVGKPGGSMHQYGEAADLAWNGRSLRYAPPEVRVRIHELAGENGLRFPMNDPNRRPYEPWHVEPVGGRRQGGVLSANDNGIQIPDVKVNAAAESLDKLNKSAADSAGGLNSFGQGLGSLGSALGNAAGGAGAMPGVGAPGAGGNPWGSLLGSVIGIAGKFFGFDEGGYTGPGAKNQPAGVVHRGEVVWSQADIARAGGVSAVEAMRMGMRGYDDGGVVGNDNYTPPSMPNVTPIRPAPQAGPGISFKGGDTKVTVNGSMDAKAMKRLERMQAENNERQEKRIKEMLDNRWRAGRPY